MPDGIIAAVEHMADKEGQPLMGHNSLAFKWSPGVEIVGLIKPQIHIHEEVDPQEDNVEDNMHESNSKVSKQSDKESDDNPGIDNQDEPDDDKAGDDPDDPPNIEEDHIGLTNKSESTSINDDTSDNASDDNEDALQENDNKLTTEGPTI